MSEISFVEMEHGLKKVDVFDKFKLVEIWFNTAEFPTISDVHYYMNNRFLKSIGAVFPYEIVEVPGYLYVKSRDPALVKVEAEYFHIRLANKFIKVYINNSV